MEKKNITSIVLVGSKKRTSNSYGKNMPYMGYRVLLQSDNEHNVPIEQCFTREELKKDLSYWSTRSNTMSMRCWGTSQLFEAQIALGKWMGFDSNTVKDIDASIKQTV